MTNLCGETYKIIVRVSSAKAKYRVCFPFLSGKNPSKTNLSLGNPLLTNAGTNAVAPGKHSTAIPFSTQARVNKNPGSEIAGVPASEINAIVSPAFNLEIKFSIVLCSLCIWWLCMWVPISKCFNNFPLVRVSSAKIKSTSFSTRMARKVMSSKFPIGVGTIYNFDIKIN